MQTALLGAIGVVLTGCMTAEMMRRPDDPAMAYAPENEAGGGEIKYLNAGADSVKAERRADAYRQMFEVCGGKYRIDSESDSEDVSAGSAFAAAMASSRYVQQSAAMNYRHVRFSCGNAAPPQQPAVARRPPTTIEIARAKEDETARGAEFGRSKYTGAKEVVDAEDKLRVRAGNETACDPGDLKVSSLEAADIPTGWAASVSGCGKAGVYFFGREGWVRQPDTAAK